MTEEMIQFLQDYQEMRSAQIRHSKNQDPSMFVRGTQIQLKLDEKAPKLLAALSLPGVYLKGDELKH